MSGNSRMTEVKITAVIPALNEEETISQVLKGVKRYADEIILVNDGSTDRTGALAEEEKVEIITHEKPLGYDKSINDGFALAAERGAGIIFTFDSDGQHNPEDIPVVVSPIIEGNADVVVGRRGHYPRVTERVFAIVARMKANVSDPLCGLKAYHIKVYNDIGFFDRISSIGTQLMFNAARRGYVIVQRDINVNRRKDTSRFGGKIKANWKIFLAMTKIILGRYAV